MDYQSGIKSEDIRREFLADLERRHARAALEVFAATSDEEIRSRTAERDELATRIHNLNQGSNRALVLDAALVPPDPPPRTIKQKLLRR